MICGKCHGELYPDLASVRDLVPYGYDGARYHCVAGCTDRWVVGRIGPDLQIPKGDMRGHYVRKMRTYRCEDCGLGFKTTGPTAKVCKPCRRKRDRQYDVERRLHRRRTA